MKKKEIVLPVVLLFGIVPYTNAQTASAVYDPNTQMTWLGLDFSLAKFVGDDETFVKSNNAGNLLEAWNDLLPEMKVEISFFNASDNRQSLEQRLKEEVVSI